METPDPVRAPMQSPHRWLIGESLQGPARQDLNVLRATDAPAEWVNNNLRSAEVDDADEARIQRDHLVLGDVGGDVKRQAVNLQVGEHQGATVGINSALHQVGSGAGMQQKVHTADVDVGVTQLLQH